MTMRQFFQIELENLDKTTGLKQYEKILEREDWEREVKELLDILCRACVPFDYIPNEAKQSAIRRAIMSPDFIGFNVRVVYNALAVIKDSYFKESHHIKTEEQPKDYKVVEGAERDEWYKKLAEAVGTGFQQVPTVSRTEKKSDKQQWKATNYDNGWTPEYVAFRDKLKRTASDFYRDRQSFSDMKIYTVNDFEVFAASQKDAEEIYTRATKK